ncbi:MAG: CHASE domain-containing protein, partial [Verrucomicrobiota bacterium]
MTNKAVKSIPAVLVFVCFAVLSIYVSHLVHKRLLADREQAFRLQAADAALELKGVLDRHRDFVEGIATYMALKQGAFFDGVESDETDFWKMTSPTIERGAGLKAVFWAPRVEDADRSAFEEKVGKEEDGFTIFEFAGLGQRGKLSAREEYMPGLFVVPSDFDRDVLGLDFNSHPDIEPVLRRACATDRVITSSSLLLSQAAGESSGVVMAHPVYREGKPVETPEQRIEHLVGMVMVYLDLEALIYSALDPQARALDLTLFAGGRADESRIIYSNTLSAEPASGFTSR